MRRALSLAAFLLMLSVRVFAQISAVPQLMNFQGRLTRPDGSPVANGNYSIRFSLWTAATGGTEKWNQTVNPVTVRNGTFAVLLNTSTGAADKFNGNLYLEIKIGTNTPLSPRQQIVSVAYAMKADSVKDGSITANSIANGSITADKLNPQTFNPLAWLLNGNSGLASGFLGTTDNNPLEFRANNHRAMQYQYAQNTTVADQEFRSTNVLGGSEINSISAGVVGATIAGGGQDYFTLADHPNRVLADFGTIGGGHGNTANGEGVTIGGGYRNTASNQYATVAGGYLNIASDQYATVAGGYLNTANNQYATVAGGIRNIASGDSATVGGGHRNTASNPYSTVAGGYFNIASGNGVTIGGGSANTVFGTSATVAGGYLNSANGDSATVAGGYRNSASDYAMVAGGQGNIAAGPYSFAAGHHATADHPGSFVWADHDGTVSGTEFASTGANQFLIRASGGVGIGNSNPAYAMDVTGRIRIRGKAGNFSGGIWFTDPATPITDRSFIGRAYDGQLYTGFYASPTGWTFRAHDNGNATVAGTLSQNSDLRYKQHIAAFDNALDAILNLRGVTYEWKEANRAPGRQIGFIAQEVEKVLPELVTTDLNGYKAVAYANVVPVLVEAMKQQQRQIQTKEQRLKKLEAENAELKARLDALAAAVAELKADRK